MPFPGYPYLHSFDMLVCNDAFAKIAGAKLSQTMVYKSNTRLAADRALQVDVWLQAWCWMHAILWTSGNGSLIDHLSCYCMLVLQPASFLT